MCVTDEQLTVLWCMQLCYTYNELCNQLKLFHGNKVMLNPLAVVTDELGNL